MSKQLKLRKKKYLFLIVYSYLAHQQRICTCSTKFHQILTRFNPSNVVREIASGGCARFKENRAKNGTHVRAVLPPMIAGGRVERCIDHGTGQTKPRVVGQPVHWKSPSARRQRRPRGAGDFSESPRARRRERTNMTRASRSPAKLRLGADEGCACALGGVLTAHRFTPPVALDVYLSKT